MKNISPSDRPLTFTISDRHSQNDQLLQRDAFEPSQQAISPIPQKSPFNLHKQQSL